MLIVFGYFTENPGKNRVIESKSDPVDWAIGFRYQRHVQGRGASNQFRYLEKSTRSSCFLLRPVARNNLIVESKADDAIQTGHLWEQSNRAKVGGLHALVCSILILNLFTEIIHSSLTSI